MKTAPPLLEYRAIERLEKLRQENLEEARAIQDMMMPTGPLRAGSVGVLHGFQPVSEVGGDFLDYFQLTDGCIGLYLGDVSGKGLPAAMYAALAVGTLRGVHKTGQSPSHVLSTLNRRLTITGTSRRHAAVQYAVFDPRTREMQISGAGMPGPIHLSSSGCRVVEVTGIPPGLFNTPVEYDIAKAILEPGDAVLFFTDGIADAFNMEGQDFGIERLQELCETQRQSSPAQILGHVFSAVDVFTRGRAQHDDMAAAIFCYCHKGSDGSS
jgi:sigma-B regulation protein RsbU (phosphoserine phosphatase)